MKTLVNGLSHAVRRWPWLVIALTVAISIGFGALSQNFTPEEDSNEAFAPDAPELAAAERISDLFGDESTTTVMQVIVKAEGGNVFSLDGLTAVDALRETVMGGALADRLVQDRPDPVATFLAPVEFATGGTRPGSDAGLRRAFHDGMADMPPGPAGFIQAMVPTDADLNVPFADQGLIIIFNRGGEPGADYDLFQEASAVAADQIRATPLPEGFVAEPFSFELLFSGNDEFQSEIGRLFGTAGLIIALVLALVFLVRPRRRAGLVVMRVGILAVATSIVLLVLPTLAVILDSVFPDSLKDWDSNALFATAGVLLLASLPDLDLRRWEPATHHRRHRPHADRHPFRHLLDERYRVPALRGSEPDGADTADSPDRARGGLFDPCDLPVPGGDLGRRCGRLLGGKSDTNRGCGTGAGHHHHRRRVPDQPVQ